MRTKSCVALTIPMLALLAGCSHMKSSSSEGEKAVSAAASAAPAATVAAEVAPSPPPAADPAAASPVIAATSAPMPSPAKAGAVAPRPARAVGASGVAAPVAPPSLALGGEERGRAVAPSPAFVPFAQSASVKAGEWDDNANYREFQKYLASSTSSFHRVDLRDRRFLVVRDSKGQGVPRCRINVSDGQKTSTSFVTTASGRAIFFPHAEGFHEGKMFASADCADGKTSATFAVGPNDPDGLVDLRIQAERRPIGTRIIDVAFVLDTTGSMAEEITAVKTTIQRVASAMSNEQTQVRVGLVEYKDRGDTFVTKLYGFSSDLPAFSQKVSQISAGGGGDTPEDMNAGLHAALTQLQWSDQSVARLAFVVGDAPPHLDYQDGPDYAVDMKRASHRGIQLFTVAASGMDALGQVVFRQMAQFTGGTNMFVLRGGAGPASTGGGDPTSSCGGTHTNYSSGKLDELIVTKIRRELRAIDADPMRIAGLKTDENAKPCNERVAFKD